jgi:anti-sigma B factor antagonist
MTALAEAARAAPPALFSSLEPAITLRLEGEIGQADLSSIFEMVFRQASRGVTKLVIDFSGVTHFDYRGVKPLMGRASVFRHAGGDLKLSGLSPYLFAIFRSAGANEAFDYFAESSTAVAAFAQARIGI